MPSVLDAANALIALATLKSYIASDTTDEYLTDTTYDNELELIINGASQFANRYTGVDLLTRSQTEYHDGDGGQTLYLNHFPVTSTTTSIAIYIDSERVYGADTKIAVADIVLYTATGKIYVDGTVFAKAPQSVKVVYVAGYALAAVPADLAYAIKLICAAMWKVKKDKLTILTNISTDGQSISLPESQIPSMALDILEEFSRSKR